MRALGLNLFLVALPFAIMMSPFVGVLAYYWLTIMDPVKATWGGLPFQWTQIVALVTLLFWLFSSESKRIPINAGTVTLFIFFSWTALTTQFALYPELATQHLIDVTKVMLMATVTMAMINTKKRLHLLIWLIVISAGFHVFWSGATVLVSAGRVTITGPGNSMFQGENNYARLCLLLIPLVYFLTLHSKLYYVRWAMMLCLALTLLALFGTGSRGGFIGFMAMAGMFILTARNKGRLILAGTALAIVAVIFVPPERFERFSTIAEFDEQRTAQTRFEAWMWGVHIANTRPLVGGGYEAFQSSDLGGQTRSWGRAAHSNYFEVLGEHGYPGLVFYLTFWFIIYRMSSWAVSVTKRRPGMKWERDLSIMLRIIVVGHLVGGITINHAFFEPMYLIAAMVVCTVGLVRSQIESGAFDVEDDEPVWRRKWSRPQTARVGASRYRGRR